MKRFLVLLAILTVLPFSFTFAQGKVVPLFIAGGVEFADQNKFLMSASSLIPVVTNEKGVSFMVAPTYWWGTGDDLSESQTETQAVGFNAGLTAPFLKGKGMLLLTAGVKAQTDPNGPDTYEPPFTIAASFMLSPNIMLGAGFQYTLDDAGASGKLPFLGIGIIP